MKILEIIFKFCLQHKTVTRCEDGSRPVLSYGRTTLSAEVETPGGEPAFSCGEPQGGESRAVIALVASHMADAMFFF